MRFLRYFNSYRIFCASKYSLLFAKSIQAHLFLSKASWWSIYLEIFLLNIYFILFSILHSDFSTHHEEFSFSIVGLFNVLLIFFQLATVFLMIFEPKLPNTNKRDKLCHQNWWILNYFTSLYHNYPINNWTERSKYMYTNFKRTENLKSRFF